MKKIYVAAAFSMVVALTGQQAYAFGLGDAVSTVTNLTGGGSDTNTDEAKTAQTDVMGLLLTSLVNLNKSQVIIADALGLKEEAAIAKKDSESLADGSFSGDDDMEKLVSNTVAVQNKINEKIAKGEALTEESKEKFMTALLPYGLGTAGMIKTANAAKDSAKGIMNITDLTVLAQLSDLLFIAEKSPDLIQTFSTSTTTLIDYSSSNGIDTSDLEASVDEWS